MDSLTLSESPASMMVVVVVGLPVQRILLSSLPQVLENLGERENALNITENVGE